MLYDPKWEVKTKTPSLAGLIAWLETQPDREYDWQKCGECVVGQYLTYVFGERPEYGDAYYDAVGGFRAYRYVSRDGGMSSVGPHPPWTFSAALARAREWSALAEEA